MTIENKLNMLILDDRVGQEAEKKGYNQIETRYPGTFEVERLQSWNTNGFSPTALDRILRGATYHLILLDHHFENQADDGTCILRQLRTSLADYNLDDKEEFGLPGERHKDVYVIGTSSLWKSKIPLLESWSEREKTANTLRNFDYSKAEDFTAVELFPMIDKYLDQRKTSTK